MTAAKGGMLATGAPVERSLGRRLAERTPQYAGDIAELVAIPTTTPDEPLAFTWLRERFERRGLRVRDEPRHPGLAQDPDANPNAHIALPAGRRANLHAELPCAGAAVRTLFSAHVDVVPAGPDFPVAFAPVVTADAITGRGAVDNKGNIVMLLAALELAAEAKLPLTREVAVDLVIEEEIGGNGALSAVLHGRAVDEVVVLEPTGLEVFHGHRGCLEFTLETRGRATHMGGARGVDAIDGAIEFIGALRALEARLVEEARADPAFSDWERPLQINVGAIDGGEWHGSVPERCRVRGAFGFLPRCSVADVRGMLERVRDGLADPWLREHSTLSYDGIHNGAYVGAPDSRVARDLRAAAGMAELPPRAWNVSCDARLYEARLGVPTVVFGAGALHEAHSSHERLNLADWRLGVLALVRFLTTEPGS